MIHALVMYILQHLNDFPADNGISSTISPSTIVDGFPKPDMKHKKICFGSYALIWIRTTNDMKRWAVPAIALHESNCKGAFYFMSLYTGKRIHSYHWERLPIPDDVISQVETMAISEKQPLLTDKLPLFEWSPGVPIPYTSITDTTDTPIDSESTSTL